MATAIAVGSLLASGASAAAGAGLISGTIAGVSLTKVAAGLSLAGQVMSFAESRSAGNQAFKASLAASRAELQATRSRVAETERAQQQEKTQFALEEAERQRKARRLIASQRATFAGGGADAFSGSAIAIQEATEGQINRQSRLAELASQGRVNALGIQGVGIQAAGFGKAASLIGRGLANREQSRLTGRKQLAQIGQSAGEFGELL